MIVSPSTVTISRNTPCVEGCCGPILIWSSCVFSIVVRIQHSGARSQNITEINVIAVRDCDAFLTPEFWLLNTTPLLRRDIYRPAWGNLYALGSLRTHPTCT